MLLKQVYHKNLIILELNEDRRIVMTKKSTELIDSATQICRVMNYTGIHYTIFYDYCYQYLDTLGKFVNFDY